MGYGRREKTRSLYLAPLPDFDANGLPDRWEQQNAIQSGPYGDQDQDGLTNAAEFEWATNPRWSDTDGGGEADGSEVSAGRDPRDPRDDIQPAPVLVPVPGNRLVYLPAALDTAGATLKVQRSPSPDGPFETIDADVALGRSYAVDRTAENDQLACYRMRAERLGVASAWSEPRCVKPRLDPMPPRVQVVSSPSSTHTRDVSLTLRYEDQPLGSDGARYPIDLGVSMSGVDSMRVWYGPGAPNGAMWLPVTSELVLRLPDSDATLVQVEARDLAGNVGPPANITILRPLQSPVDRAIADEERAEDLIDANELHAARLQVVASLAEIEKSLSNAVKALPSSTGSSSTLAKVVDTLGKIHGLKVAVVSLLNEKTLSLALDKLHQALTLEIQLAIFADREGITL